VITTNALATPHRPAPFTAERVRVWATGPDARGAFMDSSDARLPTK